MYLEFIVTVFIFYLYFYFIFNDYFVIIFIY